MAPGVFWRLTPAQLNALIRQYNIKRKREDYSFGIIAAEVRNSYNDWSKNKKGWQWTHFMPAWKNQKEKAGGKSDAARELELKFLMRGLANRKKKRDGR